MGKRGTTMLFRYEFKLGGVKRDHRLGSWPKKNLADIRAARDRVRVVVADGIYPTAAKKAARIEKQKAVAATLAEAEKERVSNLTLQDLFKVWIVDGVNRKDGNKELRRIFEKDVLPVIGGIPIRELTERKLRALLRPALAEGKVRKAQVLLLSIKQAFAWAEKRQPWRTMLIEANPADLISEDSITPPDYEEERSRVLAEAEIRELADILARMSAEYEAAPAGSKCEYERPLKQES